MVRGTSTWNDELLPLVALHLSDFRGLSRAVADTTHIPAEAETFDTDLQRGTMALEEVLK